MSDIKVPYNIEIIPYLKDVLSDFNLNPVGSGCTELKPCAPTKNADGSISHNYTATMVFHGDGGTLTETVQYSLSEKDGKFTLYRGDITKSTSYDAIRDVTTENPVKKDGSVEPIAPIVNVTKTQIDEQRKLQSQSTEKFLEAYAPQHLGTYQFHQEVARSQGEGRQ